MITNRIFQYIFSLVLTLAVTRGAFAEPVKDGAFQKTAAPILAKYCVACHGDHKQEANLRFDQLESFAVADRHLWTSIHEKLAAGEMPPKDQPQPTAAEVKNLLAWIQAQQRSLGTGGVRRLNRRELAAALQDITGLSVDYASTLPADGKVAGFDTGGEGLTDSASSLSQIMETTRRAVQALRFSTEAQQPAFAANLRDSKDARKTLESFKDQNAYVKIRDPYKPDMGLLLTPRWLGDRNALEIHIPIEANRGGVLKLELAVSSQKYFKDLPNSHLLVKVGGKILGHREISASLNEPQKLTYEVQLNDLPVGKRGLKIELKNLVEIPYAVSGFENEVKSKPEDNIPATIFRPDYDQKKSPPEKQPAPFVVLQHIEITPDYQPAWPPNNWKVKLETAASDEARAQQLLAIWIDRAWRRPVAEAEQQRFIALYKKLRTQGLSFDDALKATFQSVLLSGGFRYHASPVDPDESIAQHAIASRIAFMLTGSPPDGELRKLALAGKLREPKTLDSQVDRLLSDSSSRQFFEPFVTQWLVMDQPITVSMSHLGQQDFRFGRYLKASLQEETIAYFAELVRENRPTRELIDSNFTMTNDILAIHYGRQSIAGGEMRKIMLPKDDQRGGGILGHAGIQSMLCWMGDNWVIYRGAWTLRHILDDPPPPPPLEVPPLDPSASNNRGKTFRELLQQHQSNTKCAVCHKDMDPLGFAFQNFDLSGRWRKVEFEKYTRDELDGKVAWRGSGKTRPVDAAGRLPGGEEFTSFEQCKQLIVKHYLRDIVRGHLKRLMLYGTGRTPDVDDLAEIDEILKQHESGGYKMRDLIKAVVRSDAFLQH